MEQSRYIGRNLVADMETRKQVELPKPQLIVARQNGKPALSLYNSLRYAGYGHFTAAYLTRTVYSWRYEDDV